MITSSPGSQLTGVATWWFSQSEWLDRSQRFIECQPMSSIDQSLDALSGPMT